MNLREKLQKIKEQQAQSKPAGFPPVKEEASLPEEKKEVPGDLIRQKLLELGTRKEVNPPPTQTTEETEGEACPTCGKNFKVLAKHRCKNIPDPQTGTKILPEVVSNVALKGTAKPITKSIQQANTEKHNYVLLIDCIPSKNTPFVNAENLSAHVKKEICEEKKVEHWKLVEYGGGPALLHARFEKYWFGTSFAGTILLYSSCLEYAAIRETLVKWAREVYQGI